MRLLRSVHAWVGVVLAALVVVIALSGTLLVFKQDYLRAVFPAAREVAATDSASLGYVAGRADSLFGDEIKALVFGSAEFGLHQVHLRDGGGAYLDARGHLVAQWGPGGRPETWLFDLHQRLLAGETGHVIAGATALLVALLTLLGIVLWAPAARGFSWRIWPRSIRRRDLLTQHRNLGVIATLPILLLTLTGAAMVFPDAAKAALAWLLPSGSAAAPVTPAMGTEHAGAPELADWPEVLERAQGTFPQATLRIASWPDEQGVVSIRLKQPAEWHPNGRTRVTIAGGRVVETHDATQDPLPARAYNALYPLHASRVGGRPYDLLAAFAGISLPLLAIVGLWTFLRQRLPSSARRQGRVRPGHDYVLLHGDTHDGT
jgi:uncharacterized iron-regulated membrane protein